MRKRISEELGIELYDIYGLTKSTVPESESAVRKITVCITGAITSILRLSILVTLEASARRRTWRSGHYNSRERRSASDRYRTHDLSRILPGKCACGSKYPRLDVIMGRTDDMMKIKGVNVFPSQIEEILKDFPEVSSEYQIRISHLDGKDTMRIYVETNGSVDFLDLAKRIAVTVKSRIGFTPLVKVVELGLLPRSEKKSKRVIDERYE